MEFLSFAALPGSTLRNLLRPELLTNEGTVLDNVLNAEICDGSPFPQTPLLRQTVANHLLRRQWMLSPAVGMLPSRLPSASPDNMMQQRCYDHEEASKVIPSTVSDVFRFGLSAEGGPCILGRPVKEHHFYLTRGPFLNTASYGATPRLVTEARSEWERAEMSDPVTWRLDELPKALKLVRHRLADFLHVSPDNLAILPNANTATCTIIKSMPWQVGDSILMLSVDYDATKLAAQWLEDACGVTAMTIPISIPTTESDVIQMLDLALQTRLRMGLELPVLANFCHVTSRTAWIFPVKRMTTLCHHYNIPVLIDGAQVAGHFPVDVADIGCDYYVGVCHKWMFSCPGVGFLCTDPSKHRLVQPLAPLLSYAAGVDMALTSAARRVTKEAFPPPHVGSMVPTPTASTALVPSFAALFAMPGLYDCSTVLSTLQAFEFVDRVVGGWDAVWAYNRKLAREAVGELELMWKLAEEGLSCFHREQMTPQHDRQGRPIGDFNCMPLIPLPKSKGATVGDAQRLMGYLLRRFNITAYIVVDTFQLASGDRERLLALRLTCQIHVCMDDVRELGQAIADVAGQYTTVGGARAAAEAQQSKQQRMTVASSAPRGGGGLAARVRRERVPDGRARLEGGDGGGGGGGSADIQQELNRMMS